MASFSRSVRVGAGLAGLGYGLYRLAKGRHDWMTTTALTAGLSVTLNAMNRKQPAVPAVDLAQFVTTGIPAVSHSLIHVAEESAASLANRGWLP